MMKPFPFNAPFLRLSTLALAMLLIGASCPEPEEIPDEAPFDARQLEIGEKVEYSFDSDGQWHTTPFLAAKGDVLQVRATKASLALAEAIIEYRIGRLTQVVTSRPEFRVTQPGRIAFRVDPTRLVDYHGPVYVEIERIDK